MSGPADEYRDSESPNPSLVIDRALIVHRLVLIGLFAGLVWKFRFFVQADKIYASIPLDDDFFPALFRSQWTVRVAYLGSLAAICINFFSRRYSIRQWFSTITLAGMTILCLHQATYNDATFTTSWWTSLWITWFVRQNHLAGPDNDLRRPAFLSRMIVSMILLGGAIGKWTSEYWSGEVIYEVYFVDRNFWVFNLLRDSFEETTLHAIAKWYSRGIVMVETVCGFGLWLLPPRIAAAVGAVLLTSIAVFSNWYLFSVLFSLIALVSVGFFVKPAKSR